MITHKGLIGEKMNMADDRDINDRAIQALEKHNNYQNSVVKHIEALTKHLVEDVQGERQKNYRNLVLFLGYSVYFTTWFQLRDLFPILLMKITLMSIYFLFLINKNLKNIKYFVIYSDVTSLLFGFGSIACIIVASMCWVFK
jgi:hypothetical protein